jgi:hypothetical protein
MRRRGTRIIAGGTLCDGTPPDHPMRIVYEELFGCGAPRDRNWDAPTLLDQLALNRRIDELLVSG